MTSKAKSSLIKASSYIVSIVPPSVAVCEYIPIWSQQITTGSDLVSYSFSGLAIVAVIALITGWRYIKDKLKTPSPLVIWLFCATIFGGLKLIIDAAVVISVAGLIGSSAGAVLYKIGTAVEGKARNGEQSII